MSPACRPGRRARGTLAALVAAALLAAGPGPAWGDFCGYIAGAPLQVWREGRLLAEFRVARTATPEGRSRGLMECPSLPPGEGLLFVFPDADERAFWMENTPVALGLVFIGADRRIVSVKPGRPFDRASILSDGPAQYVLEVNAAESRGLAPGDHVVFTP